MKVRDYVSPQGGGAAADGIHTHTHKKTNPNSIIEAKWREKQKNTQKHIQKNMEECRRMALACKFSANSFVLFATFP